MKATKQVLFRLGEQLFGLDSLKVMFIDPYESVTPLYGASEAIEGIVNLRGSVLPVCSLRRCFLMKEDYGMSQIIFAEVNGRTLGLHVDKIVGISDVDESNMNSVPVILHNDGTEYVEGIVKLNDELITVIAPDKLLSQYEWTKLCSRLGDIEAQKKAEQEEEEQRRLEKLRLEREKLEESR